MINPTPQLPLFPEIDINTNIKNKHTYQIKRFDDPCFKLDLIMSNVEDNPEAVALERLGYFVVPEVSFE